MNFLKIGLVLSKKLLDFKSLVAAVFIAQTFGLDLSLIDQLGIITT